MSLGPTVAPESDDLSITLIERYCAGTVSPAERAQVEAWVLAHPDAIGWSTMAHEEIERRAQAITQSVPPPPRLTRHEPATRHIGRLWAIAAAFVAAVAFVVAGIHLTAQWVRHTEFHSRTTYTTTNGQRANIELTDGTRIVLAPATRLEIPEDFAQASRTVRLSGEAYFQVTHTTGKPFIIEAGKTQTVVLGTAFSVRAYGPIVQLAVQSGRVTVDGAVLGARDIARVTPGTSLIIQHNQSLDAALGFTTGRLVLTDVPLRDAIQDLDRWCDVDVRLGDPVLAQLSLNAILTNGSLEELLEMFQVTYGLRVVHAGRTITLYPR